MSNRVSVLDQSFRIPTVHHSMPTQGQGDVPARADDATSTDDAPVLSGSATELHGSATEFTTNPPVEPLLREALGTALKNCRVRAGFTLRELSDAAAVSPGYLSELERGRKEVSSEVLAAICAALQLRVSDLVLEAVSMMAMPPVPCS